MYEKRFVWCNGTLRDIDKRGETVKQQIRRFNHVMERVGVTLKGLGVTVHGLRHQYIQEQHLLLTGVPAPIKGGDISQLDRTKYREASQALSGYVGHGRVSVLASYYGSRQGVRRQKDKCDEVPTALGHSEEEDGEK